MRIVRVANEVTKSGRWKIFALMAKSINDGRRRRDHTHTHTDPWTNERNQIKLIDFLNLVLDTANVPQIVSHGCTNEFRLFDYSIDIFISVRFFCRFAFDWIQLKIDKQIQFDPYLPLFYANNDNVLNSRPLLFFDFFPSFFFMCQKCHGSNPTAKNKSLKRNRTKFMQKMQSQITKRINYEHKSSKNKSSSIWSCFAYMEKLMEWKVYGR